MTLKSELSLKHFNTTDFRTLRGMAYEEHKKGEFFKDCVKPELFFGFAAPGLPTPAEIEKGEFLTKQDDKFLVQHVIRVGDYVAKVTYQDTAFLEIENLLWLREHVPDLEQPKVHAFYYVDGFDPMHKGTFCKDYKCYYLIMDYIHGEKLSTAWPKLSQDQRKNTMEKLAAQYKILRSIPQPDPSYYGRINRRGFAPNTSMIINRQATWGGPYSQYTDLVEAMQTSMEFSVLVCSFYMEPEFDDDQSAIIRGFRSRLLGCKEEFQEAVLTQIDTKAANILVCEDGRVVLIDWESLAWLPKWVQWWSIRDRFFTSREDHVTMRDWLIKELGGEEDTLHQYLQHDCGAASYVLT